MRRLLPIATAAATLALIGAGGAVTARAMDRASSFHHGVATLERSWTRDVQDGVPAASIASLHRTLDASKYMHASGWSPLWWLDDGSPLLATLHRETGRAWASALEVARSRAEGAMTAWSTMELQYGAYVRLRRQVPPPNGRRSSRRRKRQRRSMRWPGPGRLRLGSRAGRRC